MARSDLAEGLGEMSGSDRRSGVEASSSIKQAASRRRQVGVGIRDGGPLGVLHLERVIEGVGGDDRRGAGRSCTDDLVPRSVTGRELEVDAVGDVVLSVDELELSRALERLQEQLVDPGVFLVGPGERGLPLAIGLLHHVAGAGEGRHRLVPVERTVPPRWSSCTWVSTTVSMSSGVVPTSCKASIRGSLDPEPLRARRAPSSDAGVDQHETARVPDQPGPDVQAPSAARSVDARPPLPGLEHGLGGHGRELVFDRTPSSSTPSSSATSSMWPRVRVSDAMEPRVYRRDQTPGRGPCVRWVPPRGRVERSTGGRPPVDLPVALDPDIRRSSSMRIARAWGRSLATVAVLTLVLTGCLKLDMALTVSPDDTVDGQIVFAVNKELLELTGQSVDDLLGDTTVPSDVEGATQEPYEDDTFVGTRVTFDSVPLERLQERSDPGSLSISAWAIGSRSPACSTWAPRKPTCRAIRSRIRSPRHSTPRSSRSPSRFPARSSRRMVGSPAPR